MIVTSTAEIMTQVIDMWTDVKKPASIIMIIDTSGSMSEMGKMAAAIAGAQVSNKYYLILKTTFRALSI